METETPTPTQTATPTETATATVTYTPTPNLYVEMTVEPSGEYARIAREISIGEYWIVMMLAAILVSIWLIHITSRLEKGAKNG